MVSRTPILPRNLARRYRPGMRILALQYAPTWLSPRESHATVEAAIDRVSPPRGAFVVLPEMCDTGWSLDPEETTGGGTRSWAIQLAESRGIHLQVGFGIRVPEAPGAANASMIAHPDGSTSEIYAKVHPFGFTDEPLHYVAGDRIVLDRVGEFRVAPSICYDLRFPELHRLSVAAGAEILAIGANWPRERATHWRALVIARAIENQAFVIAVNRTGSDPSFDYGGGSLIVGPDGSILAEAGEEPAVLEADIDRRPLDEWRATFPALADRRSELLGRLDVAGRDDIVFGRKSDVDLDGSSPSR